MFGVPRDPPWSKVYAHIRKSKKNEFALHSGGIPELFSEFTIFGITHVQVKLDAIFWQILKGLGID